MNVGKNMEGVFIVATVISTFAAYAAADAPGPSRAANHIQASAVADHVQHVVVVKAKRLTAAEKAALN